MSSYWSAISVKHQNKIRFLAKKNGVTAIRVMRNIIKHLESESKNDSRPAYFENFITGRQVETLIDSITN